MIKKVFTASLIAILFTACAELQQVLTTIGTNAPLTEMEVAKGLKEALRVGTDSAAGRLAATNGYFKDEMVKILLPPEADMIIKNANKIPGGQKLINDVVLSINRAAEDAAKEAGPVFYKAITSMTITDAMTILRGNNNAATEYFKAKTSQSLIDLYSPKIRASINKDLVAGYSAGDTWNTLTQNYNQVANTMVGQIANLKPVNVDLEVYLTQKALDGLFLKLANEEKQIRTNPMARVTDLLKRVFG